MTAPTIATPDRRNPWRIAAVALLPLMVLGLLLAALWNPQDRLDQVPAAIVNLDEPVKVDGQTVPLGRQLASGLVSGGETADGAKAAQPAADATNFQWTITDEDSAADGLADGTYAAVVTIPKGFSAAATSYGGDDPSDARQATIDVSTPPGGRVADDALARVVAATATSVMSSSLTETYVDNVLVGFNQLADGIGQAHDGAVQLQDGAGDASDGADQLADGAGQLADGAGDAADGADQLADGASQLSAGASSAADGASGVASGASGVADGASELAGGASQLADGAGQVADGARGVAGGIGESADGADDLASGGDDLAAGATKVADGNQDLADQAAAIDDALPSSDDIAAGLAQGGDDVEAALADALTTLRCQPDTTRPGCAELLQLQAALEAQSDQISDVVGQIVDGRDQVSALATGTQDLADGAQGVVTGIDGIADGNRDLADGLRKLEGGADKVAGGADDVASGADDLSSGAGQLSGGADQLATGASQLSTGVGALATGAGGVATGATDLSSGVGQLATGADGVSSGAGDLAGGVDQLSSGAGDLASGLDDASSQIPTTTDSERSTLSSVVAEPVAGPSSDSLSTGASGPLFAVMALWLGALALLTVFPPVAVRALGSTRDSLRLTLSAFTMPALVGVGTGAAVGAILAAVEDLGLGGWVGAIAVGVVASVCFVAVHQGFVGLLGNLGRGISLLIAVLIIATGVISTVPAVLEGLVGVLPVGAAQDALTGVVVPGVGGVGAAVAMLVVWMLAGLAVAVLVTVRGRRLGVRRLLRA